MISGNTALRWLSHSLQVGRAVAPNWQGTTLGMEHPPMFKLLLRYQLCVTLPEVTLAGWGGRE